MDRLPVITLRHLMINDDKCIGLQFFPSKRIHAFIKMLDNPRWSKVYQMVFVLNTLRSWNCETRQVRLLPESGN